MKSTRLSSRDMRQVSELLGQVRELGADPFAWRSHALLGLIRLLDAQVGVTLDTHNALPGKVPALIDPIDLGWPSLSDRDVYYRYYQNDIVDDPAAASLFDRHQSVRFVTTTRRGLTDDHRWYRTFSVSELRRFVGIDDFVTSSIALRPGTLHGFVIYRAWNAPPFGHRHVRLVRLFHLWLLRLSQQSAHASAPPPEITALPPRVRQTFDLLLAGLSVKQVAARMGISSATVTTYTKSLHRLLGIQSRSQLLERYLPSRHRGPLAFPAGLV